MNLRSCHFLSSGNFVDRVMIGAQGGKQLYCMHYEVGTSATLQEAGARPAAHSLLATQYPTGIPSCHTEAEEDDIIHAFRKVLAS